MKKNNKKISKKELNDTINTANVKVEWHPDPKGYFTIKPIFSKKRVFVRYYDSKNNLKYTFAGVTTLQILHEIIKRKLISRLDHAAYLGKEIEKAIIALKDKLKYIQDKELHLNDKIKGYLK